MCALKIFQQQEMCPVVQATVSPSLICINVISFVMYSRKYVCVCVFLCTCKMSSTKRPEANILYNLLFCGTRRACFAHRSLQVKHCKVHESLVHLSNNNKKRDDSLPSHPLYKSLNLLSVNTNKDSSFL